MKEKLSFIEVNSPLLPYLSPEIYEHVIKEGIQQGKVYDSVFSPYFQFSGKYGINLMEEVARYALLGSQIASTNTFDIIHAHDWLTYLAGIAAKQASGKKLIVHVHATEFDRSGENVNQQVYDIERQGMHAADHVITVSNWTRQICIDKYGIHPSKITTVHNGVENSNRKSTLGIEKTMGKKIVTFLGRVTFQKGPDYFIEAANKVLKKNKNVLFVMAGSGDMQNKMIRRVAELKIGQYFKFTGFLKGDDVDKMFEISDVYVMPSISEPFGISPLEAMRSNVPVIISKQSGVSEVLKNAIKVDFWDIDAMADSINSLLQYKGITKSFKESGKQEVEQLNWDKPGREITDIYHKLLNKFYQ